MKIYTNKQHEIVDINSTDNSELTEYEIDGEIFFGKCIDFIRGYKYEPQYQFDVEENGDIKTDENGDPIYKLDSNGEKIIQGYGLYPWIDYNQLLITQLEYENNQTVLELANIIGGLK